MIIPSANRLQQVEEYYFSRKLQEVRRLISEGRDIINLGIGNPDMMPSAETVDMLNHAASSEGNHGYQPYRGIPELRQAMADWYQRTYQIKLDADSQILPLMGSKEGIFHISMAFLNRGDRILSPNPGYLAYPAVARIVGAEPLFYDLTDESNWLPDLDALARHDLSNVKLMWVNYPHMPTGAIADTSAFQKLVDFARQHQILLCHDNPYSLILNGDPRSIFNAGEVFDCCIELNSLSKSHNMAGWRIGMAIGRSDYLDAILKVKSNLDSGMFLAMQKAAVSALGNSADWHHAQNQVYTKRKKLIFELLDQLGCSYKKESAGMFVWAKAPEKITDIEAFLDDILYSEGIFFAPGKIFGSNGEGYIRASLCAPESRIKMAIERVKERQALRPLGT